MKLNWLLSILLLSSIYHAQDPVILTINDSKVYKSEFEQIYWKNKKEKLATKEDLDEYIELFINFKRKHDAIFIGYAPNGLVKEMVVNQPLDVTLNPGDTLFYIAERRINAINWSSLDAD